MRILQVLQRYHYPDPLPYSAMFPQGVAYIAGALNAAGHEVFAVNTSYAATQISPSEHLFNELKKAHDQWQPEVMAIGGLSADFLFIRDAITSWRKLSPNTPIILGGGIVTADSQFAVGELQPDFAISGEAEFPIVALVDAIQGKSP